MLETHNKAEIARRLGKGRTTVHRWGARIAVPDVADLPKLAEILNVDLADLTRIVAADAEDIAAKREAVA